MKNKKKRNDLSLTDQKMMTEVARRLYAEAEPLLLEAFRHTTVRPCDPFDALVLVASLSQALQFAAAQWFSFQENSKVAQVMLVMGIFHLAVAMENQQIKVSESFPFCADEMLDAMSERLDEGETAFSESVIEAVERMKPMITEMSNYFASAHPN